MLIAYLLAKLFENWVLPKLVTPLTKINTPDWRIVLQIQQGPLLMINPVWSILKVFIWYTQDTISSCIMWVKVSSFKTIVIINSKRYMLSLMYSKTQIGSNLRCALIIVISLYGWCEDDIINLINFLNRIFGNIHNLKEILHLTIPENRVNNTNLFFCDVSSMS